MPFLPGNDVKIGEAIHKNSESSGGSDDGSVPTNDADAEEKKQ